MTERWPPVYDAEGLKAYISKLASTEADLHKVFYAPSKTDGGAYCQGDVLELEMGIPCIDESGPLIDGTSRYWLVVGNTCDFHREDAGWTQVVPVDQLSLSDPEVKQTLPAARAYSYARHFFLPAWPGAPEGVLLSANFLRVVSVSKVGITRFQVVARMTRGSWALLHSCLVRFLARDDGRFD